MIKLITLVLCISSFSSFANNYIRKVVVYKSGSLDDLYLIHFSSGMCRDDFFLLNENYLKTREIIIPDHRYCRVAPKFESQENRKNDIGQNNKKSESVKKTKPVKTLEPTLDIESIKRSSVSYNYGLMIRSFSQDIDKDQTGLPFGAINSHLNLGFYLGLDYSKDKYLFRTKFNFMMNDFEFEHRHNGSFVTDAIFKESTVLLSQNALYRFKPTYFVGINAGYMTLANIKGRYPDIYIEKNSFIKLGLSFLRNFKSELLAGRTTILESSFSLLTSTDDLTSVFSSGYYFDLGAMIEYSVFGCPVQSGLKFSYTDYTENLLQYRDLKFDVTFGLVSY